MKPTPGETYDDLSAWGLRDAYHFPGVLVYSDEGIEPSENVVFLDKTLKKVKKTYIRDNRHAVVDPFLGGRIKPGKLFLVFPLPAFVKSVTHHFELSLPGFAEEEKPSGDFSLSTGDDYLYHDEVSIMDICCPKEEVDEQDKWCREACGE